MMKKTGKAKKAGAVFITAVLAAVFVMQTAGAVFAEEKKASLTIQAYSEGNKISGVEWSAYQVAEMPRDGEFILTKPFEASGLDIDKLNDSKQSEMQKMAEALSDYMAANGIEAAGSGTTGLSGEMKIGDLERGLYLICQTGAPGTDLIVESTPFFTALPMMENVEGKRVMRYDVTARPKLETKAPPATEPETGESRPEETPSEESRPEESPSEESRPEETPSEESRPEETPSGESRPEERPSGESKPEETSSGESKPEESASAEVPAGGSNGGGGSNRDHGGRDNSPRTIINDPDVPLASFPTSPETPELEIVEDGPVPLAALPRLGDMGTGSAAAGLIVSLAAASAALAAFRKFGRNEKIG